MKVKLTWKTPKVKTPTVVYFPDGPAPIIDVETIVSNIVRRFSIHILPHGTVTFNREEFPINSLRKKNAKNR